MEVHVIPESVDDVIDEMYDLNYLLECHLEQYRFLEI
jgi:hypothetical protein